MDERKSRKAWGALARSVGITKRVDGAAPDDQSGALIGRLLHERPELADAAAYDQMLLGRRDIEECEIRARDFRMRVPLPSRKRRYAILSTQSWTFFVTPDTIVPASAVPIGDPVRRDGKLYTLVNSATNPEFWIKHDADRRSILKKNLDA